jgi:hypothetical protein
MSHRRTLLILDGLEPLQNPPGPEEGRVREPSLQALLRELAAFNRGFASSPHGCRSLISQITSALRSCVATWNIYPAMRVRSCFKRWALKGLKKQCEGKRRVRRPLSCPDAAGSYLTNAYDGNIRCRDEVSKRLAHDVRQGAHARKVMESYQTWFGEGPELSVLCMLGLFDRPAEEKALGVLLKTPVIIGLTESLTDLNPTGWRTVLARLRRARLLAEEDPQNRGQLDTHPLVREYYGEQLRNQRTGAWKVGTRGALLSVLVHFFENGRWGSPIDMAIEGQSLTAEDQLFILMQAALYLTATRGLASLEAHICYEHAECLCHSLNRPQLLYSTLISQWRYSFVTDKLTATMQIAKRVYSLAQKQNDPALMIGAYSALAATLCYLGDFGTSRQYAVRGVEIWRSGGVGAQVEELVPACRLLFGLSGSFRVVFRGNRLLPINHCGGDLTSERAQ